MTTALVFGGTRFFGKKLIKVLLEKGYEVTIATRGLTEDPFENHVKRVQVDRSDKDTLINAFKDTTYDLIFDNICYSPNEALSACEVFKGKVGRYIFTSTLSVYDEGLAVKEEAYNPYQYPIVYGSREDFNYGELKRLAEAVFFQKSEFPVVAVRFPVVIGEEDYTKRLLSYYDKINKGKPMYIDNIESEMSFISADEAGAFLHWIGTTDFEGPINACSNGTITIQEIVEMCETESGKKWHSGLLGSEEGAFNGFTKYTLDHSKAKEMGFHFSEIKKEVNKYFAGKA